MNFETVLLQRDLSLVLRRVEYRSLLLRNAEKVYAVINEILEKNLKTLIYGDPDPDGAMCIQIWKDLFRCVGFRNYSIFQYGSRTHALDQQAVRQAIRHKFQCIIINDTCSNELEKINELIKFGLKVIVIDHHKTKNKYEDYPAECAFVNSTLETKHNLKTSAGALCFIILDYYLQKIVGYRDTGNMACYALVSLYSDCMDMSNSINRSIYYKVMGIPVKNLPTEIGVFLKSHDTFCRRFIEFKYAPRLNCAFRQELFELINSYIATKPQNGLMELKSKVETLENLHKVSTELVQRVTDIVVIDELNDFVLANINSVNDYINVRQKKLFNYTGLVANKLADRYGKCAVVWCSATGEIKGSFRDLKSRNYLEVFQQFCDANGHPSAFGMHINPLQFEGFVRLVRKVDAKFTIEATDNSPIMIPYVGLLPDDDLLADMALYNEFSGQIPIALIKTTVNSGFRQQKYMFSGYKYRWGTTTVVSQRKLIDGSEVLLKPVAGKKPRLYVI